MIRGGKPSSFPVPCSRNSNPVTIRRPTAWCPRSEVHEASPSKFATLLSVEHGLTRRRDVNDAIRIAVENDIDADMAG